MKNKKSIIDIKISFKNQVSNLQRPDGTVSSIIRGISLIASALLFTSTLFSQSPEKMSFQAIIRNSQGLLLEDQTVGMKLSILQGSEASTAEEVYTEFHNPKTSNNGVVSIEIGTGITSDNFSLIEWESNTFYFRTDIDPSGGNNYTITGISQMLSVPYALYADRTENSLKEEGALKDTAISLRENMNQNLTVHGSSLTISYGNSVALPGEVGNVPLYTAYEITTLIPTKGEAVYNTSENLYQIYNGNTWQSFSSDCWPLPSTPNAGDDRTYLDGTNEIMLAANEPENGHGTGEWKIISGTGGSFADEKSPTTIFTGTTCTTYELEWAITTSCTSFSDNIILTLQHTPTIADAGDNRTFIDGRTTISLAANTPEIAQGEGTWSVVEGDGGIFYDSSSPITAFNGTLHEIYTLRWTISTDCDTSSDEVLVAFQKDEAGSPLTDVDGNTYNTVWIGNQLWMAENLKVTQSSDNDSIPLITDSDEWAALDDNGTQRAYCFYNNDVNSQYGALYNHSAAVNGTSQLGNEIIQGVCPDNWHLPDDAEWQELKDYVGILHSGSEGSALKSQSGWTDNGNGTDDFGFSGLAGGIRGILFGRFLYVGYITSWWSSTEYGGNRAWFTALISNESSFNLRNTEKSHGFSVRCVHD